LKEASEVSDYLIAFYNNSRRGIIRRYWFTINLNPQAKFDFAMINHSDNGDVNEKALKQEEAMSVKRAEFFLRFWEGEFKKFSAKAMTSHERELWLEPLLLSEPTLNAFAEGWIINNYFNIPEEKSMAYFNEKDALDID